MRLLLLGATGRTGLHLLELALERKYEVNVLVRDPAKIPEKFREKISLCEGSPTDAEKLGTAMEECEVDFPWSPLRTPTDFLSSSMNNIIRECKFKGVKRLIVCTAWGVKETKKDLPGWFRWLIDNSNIGPAYKDHETSEDLLAGSDLEWTVIRPVGLTNNPTIKKPKISLGSHPKPNLTISRRSVASYMLDIINNPDTIGKAFTLSSP
jgi:uncharacterized protein YbjT (DUF2867 family)